MVIMKKKFGFHNFAEHRLRISDLEASSFKMWISLYCRLQNYHSFDVQRPNINTEY